MFQNKVLPPSVSAGRSFRNNRLNTDFLLSCSNEYQYETAPWRALS